MKASALKTVNALKLAGHVAGLRIRSPSRKFDPTTPGEELSFAFKDTNLHKGFVNSKSNTGGLQAQFFRTSLNSTVECKWSNTLETFQGFPGVLHGGILGSLCDELMANAILASEGKFAMTLKASFRWKRPGRVGDQLSGRASVVANLSAFRLVEAVLLDSRGKELVLAEGVFFIPTWESFKRTVGVAIPEEIRPYLR